MISINYMMSAFLGKWNVTLGIYGLITDRLVNYKYNYIIICNRIYYVYIYVYYKDNPHQKCLHKCTQHIRVVFLC